MSIDWNVVAAIATVATALFALLTAIFAYRTARTAKASAKESAAVAREANEIARNAALVDSMPLPQPWLEKRHEVRIKNFGKSRANNVTVEITDSQGEQITSSKNIGALSAQAKAATVVPFSQDEIASLLDNLTTGLTIRVSYSSQVGDKFTLTRHVRDEGPGLRINRDPTVFDEGGRIVRLTRIPQSGQ
jgi:hypothetical protein